MKQDYTSILISVKYFGIYWELYQENRHFSENSITFFHSIRDKYRFKFGNREFKMRLWYPCETFLVSSTNVKPI